MATTAKIAKEHKVQKFQVRARNRCGSDERGPLAGRPAPLRLPPRGRGNASSRCEAVAFFPRPVLRPAITNQNIGAIPDSHNPARHLLSLGQRKKSAGNRGRMVACSPVPQSPVRRFAGSSLRYFFRFASVAHDAFICSSSAGSLVPIARLAWQVTGLPATSTWRAK